MPRTLRNTTTPELPENRFFYTTPELPENRFFYTMLQKPPRPEKLQKPPRHQELDARNNQTPRPERHARNAWELLTYTKPPKLTRRKVCLPTPEKTLQATQRPEKPTAQLHKTAFFAKPLNARLHETQRIYPNAKKLTRHRPALGCFIARPGRSLSCLSFSKLYFITYMFK